ncbi:uncharacterized protein LOC129791847 [Lutzomyia longipalpis]|uniref:uncharacterized protein LOC129791847 n=1 Tax=Lutzomyia longipalpis TaxID=7200 RepID=UPI002483B0DB|nr:uncharacterized protein LOC129791847 [Lutzomyia longipalpis]
MALADLDVLETLLERHDARMRALVEDLSNDMRQLQQQLARNETNITQMRRDLDFWTMRNEGAAAESSTPQNPQPPRAEPQSTGGGEIHDAMARLRTAFEQLQFSPVGAPSSAGRGRTSGRNTGLSLIDLLDDHQAREREERVEPTAFSRPREASLLDHPVPVSGNNAQRSILQPVKLKVDTYDGKGSLEDYLLQFSLVSQAQGWDLSQQASTLIASLRGAALAVLSEIPPAFRHDPCRLIRALKERFGREHLSDLAYVDLKARKQRPREEISAYAQDVRRLARIAFKGCTLDTLDSLTVRQFIDGLADLELQDLVRLKDPSSMEEAVVSAMKYSAARQANRASRGALRSSTLGKESPSPSRKESTGAWQKKKAAVDYRGNRKKESYKQKFTNSDERAKSLEARPAGLRHPPEVGGQTSTSMTLHESSTESDSDDSGPSGVAPECRRVRLCRRGNIPMPHTGRGMVVQGSLNAQKMGTMAGTLRLRTSPACKVPRKSLRIARGELVAKKSSMGLPPEIVVALPREREGKSFSPRGKRGKRRASHIVEHPSGQQQEKKMVPNLPEDLWKLLRESSRQLEAARQSHERIDQLMRKHLSGQSMEHSRQESGNRHYSTRPGEMFGRDGQN